MRGTGNASTGLARPPARPSSGPRDLPDASVVADQLAVMRPALLALGRRLTRDEHAAEDVVQNAFEKALRHASEFEALGAAHLGVADRDERGARPAP